MFLTTNRISQFDEAILSRIHLTLKYDGLDKATKEQIWGQFLGQATCHGPVEVHRSELDGLIANKFNGRQVLIHQISSNSLCLLLLYYRSRTLSPYPTL